MVANWDTQGAIPQSGSGEDFDELVHKIAHVSSGCGRAVRMARQVDIEVRQDVLDELAYDELVDAMYDDMSDTLKSAWTCLFTRRVGE